MENAPGGLCGDATFLTFSHSGRMLVEHGAGDPLPTEGFSYRKHGKAGKVGNNLLKPLNYNVFRIFVQLFRLFPHKKRRKSRK